MSRKRSFGRCRGRSPWNPSRPHVEVLEHRLPPGATCRGLLGAAGDTVPGRGLLAEVSIRQGPSSPLARATSSTAGAWPTFPFDPLPTDPFTETAPGSPLVRLRAD